MLSYLEVLRKLIACKITYAQVPECYRTNDYWLLAYFQSEASRIIPKEVFAELLAPYQEDELIQFLDRLLEAVKGDTIQTSNDVIFHVPATVVEPTPIPFISSNEAIESIVTGTHRYGRYDLIPAGYVNQMRLVAYVIDAAQLPEGSYEKVLDMHIDELRSEFYRLLTIHMADAVAGLTKEECFEKYAHPDLKARDVTGRVVDSNTCESEKWLITILQHKSLLSEMPAIQRTPNHTLVAYVVNPSQLDDVTIAEYDAIHVETLASQLSRILSELAFLAVESPLAKIIDDSDEESLFSRFACIEHQERYNGYLHLGRKNTEDTLAGVQAITDNITQQSIPTHVDKKEDAMNSEESTQAQYSREDKNINFIRALIEQRSTEEVPDDIRIEFLTNLQMIIANPEDIIKVENPSFDLAFLAVNNYGLVGDVAKSIGEDNMLRVIEVLEDQESLEVALELMSVLGLTLHKGQLVVTATIDDKETNTRAMTCLSCDGTGESSNIDHEYCFECKGRGHYTGQEMDEFRDQIETLDDEHLLLLLDARPIAFTVTPMQRMTAAIGLLMLTKPVNYWAHRVSLNYQADDTTLVVMDNVTICELNTLIFTHLIGHTPDLFNKVPVTHLNKELIYVAIEDISDEILPTHDLLRLMKELDLLDAYADALSEEQLMYLQSMDNQLWKFITGETDTLTTYSPKQFDAICDEEKALIEKEQTKEPQSLFTTIEEVTSVKAHDASPIDHIALNAERNLITQRIFTRLPDVLDTVLDQGCIIEDLEVDLTELLGEDDYIVELLREAQQTTANLTRAIHRRLKLARRS